MLASKIDGIDPDLIEIGMELTIPNLETNLADPGARAEIKKFLADMARLYQSTDRRWSQELYENLMYTSNAL
jgi:hypothetical protein